MLPSRQVIVDTAVGRSLTRPVSDFIDVGDGVVVQFWGHAEALKAVGMEE
jgi:hypothetical protein